MNPRLRSRGWPVLGSALAVSAFGALIGVGTLARSEVLAPRLAAPNPAAAFPFAEYDALLKKYVDEQGRVDYSGLKQKDAESVEKLYAVVAATGPDKTPNLYKGKDAALAYYLSAYNVLVWKNVIDHLPNLKRVDENGYSFFKSPSYQVNGKELPLDDLEKKVIRPLFKDGRVHFALNCASGGCPKLPREAFTPEKVQSQLDREAKRFCGEPRNVGYDAAAKKVKLSMIFKWYQDDFGGSEAAVLAYINKYRPEGKQIPADTKIDYVDYDWRMNNKSLPDR